MNDPELFNLCREVYKRTGWEETYRWWMPEVITNVSKIDTGQIMVTDNYLPVYQPEGSKIGYPLYTSDYLLEKLPQELYKDEKIHYLTLRAKYGDEFKANYVSPSGYLYLFLEPESDSPLKTLLNLVIALDDAGELK